jgi:hypothetical protein
MAEQVTGTIGSDDVALNNAATEATLIRLINTVKASSGKNIEDINKALSEAGLDPEKVKQLDQGFGQLYTRTDKASIYFDIVTSALSKLKPVITSVDNALQKLSQGGTNASELYDSFKGLGLGIGAYSEVQSRLLGFQEKNMETFYKLSQSGINFSGDLNGMRTAANRAYLTLDQLNNVVEKNRESFAMMGGGTDKSVQSFLSASNIIQKQLGPQLRAMGVNGEEFNNRMASFIGLTGGRTAAEMKNTDQLKIGTMAYLEQLDGLARVTGKSKEEQENQLKEAMKNAAFQAKLQTLPKEQRDAIMAQAAQANAIGGAAALDKLMSDVLGVPADKLGQSFTVVSANAAAAQAQQTKNILAGTVNAEQVIANNAKMFNALEVDMQRVPNDLAFVVGRTGSDVGKAMMTGKAAMLSWSQMTKEQREEVFKNKTSTNSLAGTMGDIQNKTAELTAEVNVAMGLLSAQSLPNVIKDLGYFADALKVATDAIGKNPSFWYETIKNTAISIGVLGTVIAATIGIAKTAALLKMVRGGPGILGGGAAKVAGPAAGSLAGWKAGATASQGAVGATSRIGAGAAASAATGAAATAGGLAKGLAKGAGVGLVTYGGDYVAGKMGLGGKEVNEAQDEKNWQQANFWEKMQSSVARGVENVGDFIVPNLANQARTDRIADETKYLKEKKDREDAAKKAEETPAATEVKTGSGTAANTSGELTVTEIKNLNTTMKDVLRVLRTTIAENTDNTRKAVERLDSDFARKC